MTTVLKKAFPSLRRLELPRLVGLSPRCRACSIKVVRQRLGAPLAASFAKSRIRCEPPFSGTPIRGIACSFCDEHPSAPPMKPCAPRIFARNWLVLANGIKIDAKLQNRLCSMTPNVISVLGGQQVFGARATRMDLLEEVERGLPVRAY